MDANYKLHSPFIRYDKALPRNDEIFTNAKVKIKT